MALDLTRPILPPESRRNALVVAGFFALGGLLLGLSFPFAGLWPLVFVAPAPIMLAGIAAERRRTVLWTGWLIGWVWWLIMIRWLYPVTVGGTIAVCAYLGLYFPVAALLGRWIYLRWRLPMTLVTAMVWTSLELVRGWMLAGGFGWFFLAHALGPTSPEHGANWLVQTADLFGQHTVSFVVAMVSGLVVDLLIHPLKPAKVSRGISSRVVVSSALCAAVLASALLYGAVRIRQVDASTQGRPTFRVCVIQTNVPHENKVRRDREQLLSDWSDLLSLTFSGLREAGECDVIVWPETATPYPVNDEAYAFFLVREAEVRRRWERMVARQRADGNPVEDETFPGLSATNNRRDLEEALTRLATPVFVGTPAWDEIEMPDDPNLPPFIPLRRTNAVLLMSGAEPHVLGRYDKVHRVPFGEYIPWVDRWPWLKRMFLEYLSPYKRDYSVRPGSELTVFGVPAAAGGQRVRVVTPICYEDAVGRLTRRMVYEDGGKRADAVLNLTNDAWYTGTAQPVQHLQIATFRAIELRVPMARSVNTGVSAFIDASGRIEGLIPAGVQGHLTREMRLSDATSLYGLVGSWPMGIMAALTGTAALAALTKPRRRDGIERQSGGAMQNPA